MKCVVNAFQQMFVTNVKIEGNASAKEALFCSVGSWHVSESDAGKSVVSQRLHAIAMAGFECFIVVIDV